MAYELLLAAGRSFTGSGRASLLTSFPESFRDCDRFFERLGNVLDCEAKVNNTLLLNDNPSCN